MSEILGILFNASVLIFVLTSMLGLGLGLKLPQIIEPLTNTSLIGKALAANFIVAPVLAFGIARLMGLDMPFAIGLIILGVCAGAPVLAKYAEIAKGDLAYTLGLMVLLQVITIIFAPLVLPLLADSVAIDSGAMLRSLITTMLIPLAAGLFIKARYEPLAETLIPHMSQASSITFMAQLVLALPLAGGDLLGVIGTGAIATALLFIVGCLGVGYLLGGSQRETRVVTALGTSQRNISAAMLIVTQNFSDPKVLLMVLTGSGLMMVVSALTSAEFGKQAE